MAVPVVESFTYAEDDATVTTLNLTDPTGITSGDAILLIHCSQESNPTLPSHSTPSNGTWTEIEQHGSSSSDVVVSAWIGDWDDVTGQLTLNQTSGAGISGWAIRISGADLADLIDGVSTAGDAGNATQHTIGGFTTTDANTLAFYVICSTGGDTGPHSINSGVGWTEQDDQAVGTGAGDHAASWGTKSMATAGATGDVVIDISGAGDGAAWFQFSINESAGGGGGITISVPTGPRR